MYPYKNCIKMEITKEILLDLLEDIDPYLKEKVYLIAVGGTALTLLDIKHSTLDIDFNLPREKDSKAIRRLFTELGFEKINEGKWISPNNLVIDLYDRDYIFCVQLIEDSMHNSKLIQEYMHITLKTLNPYDIIITKLARAESKDIDDIIEIFKKCEIYPKKLFQRYRETMEISVVAHPKENILELFQLLESRDIIKTNEVKGEIKKWNP